MSFAVEPNTRTENQRTLYMGIDPGASGGIAVVGEGFAEAFPIPATYADTSDLLDELEPKVVFAIMERVHSSPQQGVRSAFSFGQSKGMLLAMLACKKIPFDDATPQRWMKHMRCMTKGDKNVTKAKAQAMFPHLKVTHKIADALLIAEYCRQIRTA